MPTQPSWILAAVDDLFFAVKIQDAAKRAGLGIRFIKSEETAIAGVKESPSLVIVDLNCRSVDGVALIRQLKSVSGIRILAYVSHVEVDHRRQALEAGADSVMPRSAFSKDLGRLLLTIAPEPAGDGGENAQQ